MIGIVFPVAGHIASRASYSQYQLETDFFIDFDYFLIAPTNPYAVEQEYGYSDQRKVEV